MKPGVKVYGAAETARALGKLSRGLGDATTKSTKATAGFVAKDLVRRTQPWGMGGKAKDQGLNATRSQVASVMAIDYDSPNTYRDLKEFHERQRDRRGRVRKSLKAKHRMRVPPYQAERLLSRKSAMVGLAKGGWFAGVQAMGTPGRVQKWITRHLKAGRVQVAKTGYRAAVDLHNQVPHARANLTTQQERQAMFGGYRAYMRFFEKASAEKKRKYWAAFDAGQRDFVDFGF